MTYKGCIRIGGENSITSISIRIYVVFFIDSDTNFWNFIMLEL